MLGGLELDDYSIVDDHVEALIGDLLTKVIDRDEYFPSHGMPTPR